MAQATCRYCNAPIRFARLAGGSRTDGKSYACLQEASIPVLLPQDGSELPPGQRVVVYVRGAWVRCVKVERGTPGAIMARESHHAYCPQQQSVARDLERICRKPAP